MTKTMIPLLSVLLVSSAALAAPPADGKSKVFADPFVNTTPARFIMGLKIGGGGALYSEPNDTRLRDSVFIDNQQTANESFGLPLFDETRGGWTMSTGFFVQGIFYDYLGLEVGLHFTQHNILEEIDWSYIETVTINGATSTQVFEAKSEQSLSWTAVHIPILVKAVIPSGKSRVSLGIGPEFALGSWSRGTFKITEGGVDSNGDGRAELPGNRGAFTKLLSQLEDSVYLNVVFGIEIIAGDFIIPIDLSWSYNFSQEKRYLERGSVDRLPAEGTLLTRDNHPTTLTLKTRDDMYGALRIGLAYQF